MKRIVLTFGLISGLISSVLMLGTLPFAHKIGAGSSMLLGYTTMVASLLLVYFGVRSYRENVGNGHISFGRAFAVGISISLIMCLFYIATWEVMYFKFMPDFMDTYAARALDKARAQGATPATLETMRAEFAHEKQLYDNPLTNAAMTFLEPFPVALLITLLSAALLRRKPRTEPEPAASPASS